MSATSQMWCYAPNSANLLPAYSSRRQPGRSASMFCHRGIDSPKQAPLLQISATPTIRAANTEDKQNSPLVSSNPDVLPGIIRGNDNLLKRRITLTRLIKGVYELEYRRLQGISLEKIPEVRSWWESVHYDLVNEFELDHVQKQPVKNIDLAVYKWNSSASGRPNSPVPICRSVVIAIRGTLLSMEDGWHNLHGSVQRLHLTSRYRQILEVVKREVKAHGSDEICITGHSLGAALGLIVARTLATEQGIGIDCHFFNPIYAYTWIPTFDELLENDGLWIALRAVHCATVAGLANIFIDDASRVKIASEYAQLQHWTPHIYINTGDPICRGYWEYFNNHERLARNGALGAYFAHLAAPFSGRGLLTTVLGSKPSHLIPSAVLHVCEGQPPDWPGTDFSNRNRYSGHNLVSWMTEDLRIHTREVRLLSW